MVCGKKKSQVFWTLIVSDYICTVDILKVCQAHCLQVFSNKNKNRFPQWFYFLWFEACFTLVVYAALLLSFTLESFLLQGRTATQCKYCSNFYSILCIHLLKALLSTVEYINNLLIYDPKDNFCLRQLASRTLKIEFLPYSSLLTQRSTPVCIVNAVTCSQRRWTEQQATLCCQCEVFPAFTEVYNIQG